jgi:preprotein translocase subunit SecY
VGDDPRDTDAACCLVACSPASSARYKHEQPRTLEGPSGGIVNTPGITPFVTGFVLVELLSFVLPICGKLRRGGIAGRSKLNAFSIRVGLWLALVQAAADIPAADRRAGWGKGGTEIPDYFLSCPA